MRPQPRAEAVTIENCRAAWERIRPHVARTRLLRSKWLSRIAGAEVFLKLECEQKTGSFKLRGALNRLLSLTEDERRKGVITISAGNHGKAVAYAAQLLGISATIVVPENVSPAKLEAIRSYPAGVRIVGKDYDEAEAASLAMAAGSEWLFVSPYNDEWVICGQGTIALEILEERPDVETIVIPLGGGGLGAGIAVAAKELKPSIRICGVEPAASPTFTRCIEAGKIVWIEEDHTTADGLAGNLEAGCITFDLLRSRLDEVVTVSEEEIREAIAMTYHREGLKIEGASAAAVASILNYSVDFEASPLALILTGSNIHKGLFEEILRHRPLTW